ncbi:MAG: ABC transporter ATP-binding protein [SAR324 cluster bacterium]|nr:ABC transporter ATP-binding protein [SAR324 cluster bacterium]
MQAILQIADVTTGYGSRKKRQIISSHLNLDIFPGEFICLLGPNGSGKSTLLRTLTGMQDSLGGQIRIGDVLLSDLSMEQRAHLLAVVLTVSWQGGPFSVEKLVELGRTPYTNRWGTLAAEDKQQIEWALKVTSIEHLRKKDIQELSDGEKQRVMIARALAQTPELIILDEPTAFLDLPHRIEILQLLRELAYEQNKAVLLSIHDLELAIHLANRIWLMDSTGNCVSGTPEDLILQNRIQAVFDRDYMRFDPWSGNFRVIDQDRQKIGLVGEGLAALWTTRALERNRFHVEHLQPSDDHTFPCITVIEQPVPAWKVILHDNEQEFDSIEQLMKWILSIHK